MGEQGLAIRRQKILLTGGTGFLGSHLLRAFVENGFQVVILKRSFSDTCRIRDYLDKVESFDIDVVPLEEPFEKCGQFDYVVHTAVNYGRSDETAVDVFKTNLDFPLRLIHTAAQFNTATFFNTTTILNQYLNFYTLSKRHFEDWGRIYANHKKIRFVSIRLEHMYGPGDSPSKFTTYVVQSCLKNIPELALTPGEQKRDFIYIDDVVETYLKLIENCTKFDNEFQEYELGSGKAISIREYVETVHSLTNSATILKFGALPYRDHETMHSEADISKLMDFGWKQKHNLDSGLRKMIEEERRKGNNPLLKESNLCVI